MKVINDFFVCFVKLYFTFHAQLIFFLFRSFFPFQDEEDEESDAVVSLVAGDGEDDVAESDTESIFDSDSEVFF